MRLDQLLGWVIVVDVVLYLGVALALWLSMVRERRKWRRAYGRVKTRRSCLTRWTVEQVQTFDRAWREAVASGGRTFRPFN